MAFERLSGSSPRARADFPPQKTEEAEEVFDNPEMVSATTLKFTMPESEGRELRPESSMLFRIPEAFRGRIVRDVVLQHRKAEKYRVEGDEKWDPHGAYSRVELHDTTSDEWKQWRDPAGYNSDKYAEWRSSADPEVEVLHDWVATVGQVKPDSVRVTNVGKHKTNSTSQIHDLEVVFFPESEGTEYQERVYTPGTTFTDLEAGKLLPEYGGGERTGGVYKNAIVLNGSRERSFPTSKDPGPNARLEHNRLALQLESGKKLVQVEVAIGDTEHSETGSHRLGWAKLWVGVQHQDGRVDWFIQKANIPPQGVIAGGPHESMINPGDQLVIEVRSDTAYLMGWRLAYTQSREEEAVGTT